MEALFAEWLLVFFVVPRSYSLFDADELQRLEPIDLEIVSKHLNKGQPTSGCLGRAKESASAPRTRRPDARKVKVFKRV